MINQKIIEILKEDIKELKKKGLNDYKFIKGLHCFGFFEVDLMVYISKGISGFYKSYRTIKFKSENSRNAFLNKCKGIIIK